MNKLIDLKDLLKHEILDLYSAEEQIVEVLPFIIKKVNKQPLKETLIDYLKMSIHHKDALDIIKRDLTDNVDKEKTHVFFSNLFGGSNSIMSKGIEGLIKEAKKVMNEDMTPEVADASIIGAMQKIGHYKIAGYGTVLAYAVELKLEAIVKELGKTLREEYEINNVLTKLALNQVNIDAENAVDNSENIDDIYYDRLENSVSIMVSSRDDDYEK